MSLTVFSTDGMVTFCLQIRRCGVTNVIILNNYLLLFIKILPASRKELAVCKK